VVVKVASALGAGEGVAGLGDETLALAPVESTCHVSTLTTVVALIAGNDFLSRQLNWFLNLLADAIGHG
jgi:hypothetical protein